MQPNPIVFTRGRKYTVSFDAMDPFMNLGVSSLTVLINSPPSGGTFSVCLLNLADKNNCIKTGLSVVDEFRIKSTGWADDEENIPLLYMYGYETEPDPETGNITLLWFDPVKDNVRDMTFPKGSITVMAHIIDSVGGTTAMLEDTITLADEESPQARRRLLQAGGFMAKAKAKHHPSNYSCGK